MDNNKKWGTELWAESSEKPQSGDLHDNIIAIESKGITGFGKTVKASNMAVAAATAIVHGAGHNAGLGHGGDKYRVAALEYIRMPYNNVMISAPEMYRMTNLEGGSTRNFKKLQDFVNSADNKQGIIHQKYIDRFGTNNPAPKLPVFSLPKK